MGHLLTGIDQHLLADQLPQQDTFRLITNHFRRIKLRTTGQLGCHCSCEQFTSVTIKGTAAVDRPLGFSKKLRVGRPCFVLAYLRNLVPLVQRNQHRQRLLAQQIDDEGIAAAGALTPLQQQKHQIDLTDSAAGASHQPLPKQMMGLVNTRRIHQHHLCLLRGEDGPQTVSRGLRHRRGDRHLFSHQLIHQGGLTHIGATDQSDETGAMILR